MRRNFSVERLEDRRVLSATPGTISLTDGELVICGTDANNTIIVAEISAGIFVAADFLTDSQIYASDDVTSITITGGDGDDVLMARTMTQSVNIDAEAGTDFIYGGAAADILRGGEGNDLILGGAGNDELYGDAGADRLLGHAGDDTIDGGADHDFVFGHDGEDDLSGGEGNDSLFGDADADSLSGGAGDDMLIGADGDDRLQGDDGADRLFGVDGVDRIEGGAGDDMVYGGSGDDAATGGDGADQMIGGTGSDVIAGMAGADRIFGGEGDDVLIGGTEVDMVDGQEDDDVLIASTTTPESDVDALIDAADNWRSRSDYATGVQAVQTALAPNTVDDNGEDVLNGSVGQDAYFLSPQDSITSEDTEEYVYALNAASDSYSATPLETLSVAAAEGLLANDTDRSSAELSVNTTPISAPSHGTLTLNADGSFAYEHTGTAGDVDTFVYQVTNADGQTAQATVTISAGVAATIPEDLADDALVTTLPAIDSLGSNVVYEIAPESGTPDELKLAVDDHFSGDTNSPLTLIEYVDFQCPACASYHEIVKDLKAEYSDELLVVTRHFPLTNLHSNAMEAALYAEAAGAQGKFDEMADMLFSNQADWSELDDPTSVFDSYIADLGLDATTATNAVAASTTMDRVDHDLNVALKDLGLSSTPSLFINGTAVPTTEVPNASSFSTRIATELSDNTQPFSIDVHSGEIRIVSSDNLDFETNPTVTLEIIATGASDSISVPLAIRLTDVADETQTPSLPPDATFTVAANGLEVYDLQPGDGDTPTASNSVRVAYTGYLPNGTVFDSNTNAVFGLGNVIQGFSEGIQGMQVGGVRRIVIPPDLGYGSGGNPGAGILGTDTIVFDVILREITA